MIQIEFVSKYYTQCCRCWSMLQQEVCNFNRFCQSTRFFISCPWWLGTSLQVSKRACSKQTISPQKQRWRDCTWICRQIVCFQTDAQWIVCGIVLNRPSIVCCDYFLSGSFLILSRMYILLNRYKIFVVTLTHVHLCCFCDDIIGFT